MSEIITRAGKGSPLTNAEVDANFTNLNSGKAEQAVTIEAGAGLTGGGDLSANRSLSLATSGVTAAAYGGNNSIPSITIDQYGRVTLASAVTPSGTWGISVSGSAASVPFSGVSGKPTTLGGYGITDAQAALVSGTNIKTVNGVSILGEGNLAISAGVESFNARTGVVTLSSIDVTNALGYTPYSSSNPSGYITSINSSMVTTALGYTPYNSSNPSGYITGINSSMVTTALGYTPPQPNGTGASGTWGINITGSSGSTASATNATTAGRIDSSVRNYSREWIEFPNHTGLYSPLNGAHFYPNPNTYGGWRVDGSRNGWQGIEFQGQATLMMNDDTYGIHRNVGGSWRIYVTGGSVYCPGNMVAYWSDRRLKENFRPIGREAIEILSHFTTFRFNWNQKVEEMGLSIAPGKEEIGLVAQDVQERLPDAVQINQAANKVRPDGTQEETDYLTINWDKITPILVGAVNIHDMDITALRHEIEVLKQALVHKGML
jgi:hypothetical protein